MFQTITFDNHSNANILYLIGFILGGVQEAEFQEIETGEQKFFDKEIEFFFNFSGHQKFQ